MKTLNEMPLLVTTGSKLPRPGATSADLRGPWERSLAAVPIWLIGARGSSIV
jgi:hypothetical protein